MEKKVVVDIQLVQSNECGGSYHMEKTGLTRSLKFLDERGLELGILITDRHRQLGKFLREEYPEIDHLFDIWHIGKEYVSELMEMVAEMCKAGDTNHSVPDVIPPPLNAAFEKTPKVEAVAGKISRYA
ncbi:hypothetical protein ScPMuIL_016808 [Solemya velum]